MAQTQTLGIKLTICITGMNDVGLTLKEIKILTRDIRASRAGQWATAQKTLATM